MRTFQFSDSGELLLVTSPDQTVQVYDVASRARLGDPIATDSPEPVDRPIYLAEGWLRQDGQAIEVNTRLGVSVWSIDPATLADAACSLAGRNLTQTEWETYLGHLGPYRETCPQFPS